MPAKTAKWADKLPIILMALVVIFVIYWAGYANFRYYSFQGGWFDAGAEVFSFYYHLHWPGAIGGLQYISFAQHIDPFELLLLPIFAIWQKPITLFLLQDIALAAAAVVGYFIGKDLLDNKWLGFALALAFLISPAVRGVTLYDFHPEAFIPVFYLLAFYFYMRAKKVLFLLSYALLLSVIETAVVVGASLLVGLLIYELINYRASKRKDWKALKDKICIAGIGVFITIAFFAFYSFSLHALASAYANGGYSSMPPFFKVMNFYQSQSTSLLEVIKGVNLGSVGGIWFVIMAAAGIIVLLFGFGPYALRVPLVALVLLSPWLFEVLVLHNPVFPTFSNEYYAYVIGGAMAAASLGLMKLKKDGKLDHSKAFIKIVLIAAILSMVVFPITQLFPPSGALNPANWGSVPGIGKNLSSLASTLPQNSTIMAQPGIASHLYYFQNLEMTPSVRLFAFNPEGFTAVNLSFYWFRPEYVIIDKRLPDYDFMNSSAFNVYEYMGSNYTVYASSGNITIYKSG
jgi:uncharacterized membrane protein